MFTVFRAALREKQEDTELACQDAQLQRELSSDSENILTQCGLNSLNSNIGDMYTYTYVIQKKLKNKTKLQVQLMVIL